MQTRASRAERWGSVKLNEALDSGSEVMACV